MADALEKMQLIKDRRRYQGSLAEFVKAAWQDIDPAPLAWNWHHDVMCEHVEAVYRGQIKRLAVALPPRHTKSSIISVASPAWGWTWEPGLRYLCASYVIGLALRDAQRCRELIDSEWYQKHFGSVFKMAKDQNAKARYENNQHGYRIATSVGGSGTGEGGAILLIDDPHNIQQAESDAIRKETLAWYDNTMASRLNNQQEGGIIIIGQRVHANDLIGHVLGQGGWDYLCLPSLFEQSRKTFTSIGWSDPRTEEGEPLWKERFPVAVLENLKIILQLAFFAQYQQLPVTAAGNIIKAVTLLPYKDEGETYLLYTTNGEKRVLKFLCRGVVSTDLAVSENRSADMTCFLHWDICPDGEALLLEIVSGRWEDPDAEKHLENMLRRIHNLWCVLLEDVAFQKSVIQRFRRHGWPVRPYKPIRDKVARTQSISVYFALGYFFFDRNIDGFTEYKKQLLGFPKEENDDFVDATSIMEELYAKGEPQMTALEVNEIRERVIIDEIALYNPQLAEFLSESLLGE